MVEWSIFTGLKPSYPEIGFLALAIGVIWLLQRLRFSRSNSLPPGPRGLPWIGYTPCLGSQAFDELQHLKSKYGDVVSFTLFGNTVVLLNTYEAIHEVASNSNRQKLGRYTLTTNHWLAKGFGISNYDTPRALELRQALLRHLYGYKDVANYLADDSSPSELRETVRKEIRQLIQTLTLGETKSIEFLPLARLIVWNVMWTIVFGRPCEIGSTQIKHVLDQISRNNKENSMLQAIQLFPKQWLFIVDRIPWIQRFLKMDRLYSRYAEVNAVLRDQLRLHDTNTDNSHKALISRFRNDRGLDIQRNELERLIFELMAAGTDTSSLTLTAACIYLSEQTGPLSRDCFRDHLNRIHRQANVVPLALPHVAREPIQLAGYSIPAQSIVIFNLYAIHQVQLSQFCPHEPIPFSDGSRVCPGQRLASKVIEDIVWALDQHFVVENGCTEHATNLPNGSVQMKHFQASRGLTRAPEISKFIFHRRSNS